MEINTNQKPRYRDELPVCGFEAVRAMAQRHPEKINRLFFAQDKVKYFGNVCKMLAEKHRIYRVVEDEGELQKLGGSVHHQGVVAMIDIPEIPLLGVETINRWAENRETVVLCDRVGNAQNFGAIIRSAAFFGATNIVISAEDGQAGITTSAYRVAQGGMEYVDIYKVSTAAWALARAEGKMLRVAAHQHGRVFVSDLPDITRKHEEGVMAVLGNEETGISPETKKNCDYLVRIPGSGAIESLNVAQAAAVFIYGLTQCGANVQMRTFSRAKRPAETTERPATDFASDNHEPSDFAESLKKHRLF